MEFAGRTAVVTGGGRGIGRAIALTLAKEGADIVIPDLDIDSAKQTASEIESLGRKTLVQQVSVTDLDRMEELARQTIDTFGSVYILVNNAGITKDNLLLRMEESDWDAVLGVNLKGVYITTKVFLRYMLKRREGRIVNISSSVARTGNAGQCNYSASKAGIIGFTKSLAREIASRNITVNAVGPGFIQTEMTAKLPEELKKKIVEDIPMGRFGTPEDVASVVKFLCSRSANYITGHFILVDGGLAM